MLHKLISGGQTGVDRAALEVGLALDLAVGGGCPQGRRAEDERIPDRYPLVETPERNYEARTRRNIEDADGTLILNLGKLDGGTALTADHAQRIGKPWTPGWAFSSRNLPGCNSRSPRASRKRPCGSTPSARTRKPPACSGWIC